MELLTIGAPDSANFQGDGIREISASFSTDGQHGIGEHQGALESQEDRATTGNTVEQETPIGVATCLLSIPACLRRGGPVLPLALRTYSPEIKAQQAIFDLLPVYPELVVLVGGRVPDYRGIFLRGQGSQTSTHSGTVLHSSGALGQLQGDAIREMKGEAVMAGGTENGLYSGVLNSAHYDTEIAWLTSSGKTQVQFRRLQFVASKALPVANENRPVNRAVRYIIRAR